MEDDSSHIIIFVASCLGSVFLYGFFVAAADAILRSYSSKLPTDKAGLGFGLKPARAILARTDFFLLVCQAGTILSLLLCGLFSVFLIPEGAKLLSPLPLGSYGLAAVLLILVLSTASLLWVQFLRALVFNNPCSVLCLTAYPLLWFSRLLFPLIFAVRAVAASLLSALKLRPLRLKEFAISSEEISQIVEQSSEAGKIEEDEGDMLQGVIHFSDLVVREVMTPRKDVVTVEIDAGIEEVLKVFTDEGFSRVLVIGEDLDDVQGVLIAKDLIHLVGRNVDEFDIRKLMRPPFVVQETMKIDKLLGDFKKEALHFAVVLDEHGGVAGVVTLEDLVEEIVGDIFDEFDSPEEEIDFTETKSGDLLVDGSALITDINEAYAFNIPEGEYDTVAGFIIHRLGKIPSRGDLLQYNGVTIRVERVSQNRITLLRIISAVKSNNSNELKPIERRAAGASRLE